MVVKRVYRLLRDYIEGCMNILFPNCCLICDIKLDNRKDYFCENCNKTLPLTDYYNNSENNEMYKIVNKNMNIYHAYALYFYSESNPLHKVIELMKYKNRPDICFFLGSVFGEILSQKTYYEKYDVILPIPLHRYRLLQRGYNQSEMIAKGLQQHFPASYIDTGSVIRSKNTATQTLKHAKDRMQDMEHVFTVIHPQNLNNKNILIVDDVFTTGATIMSCAKEILDNCNNCKISILVVFRAQ